MEPTFHAGQGHILMLRRCTWWIREESVTSLWPSSLCFDSSCISPPNCVWPCFEQNNAVIPLNSSVNDLEVCLNMVCDQKFACGGLALHLYPSTSDWPYLISWQLSFEHNNSRMTQQSYLLGGWRAPILLGRLCIRPNSELSNVVIMTVQNLMSDWALIL